MLDAIINPESIGETMNYFENVKSLEDLRKTYHRLAFQNHPDRGGDLRVMQTINKQYKEFSKKLIDGHIDFSEEHREYEQNVSLELQKIIFQIITFPGIEIELIGTWLWITGNTFSCKEKLKTLGFVFSPPKTAWYWHQGEYVKKTKALQSMEELRELWGTQKIQPNVYQQQSIY